MKLKQNQKGMAHLVVIIVVIIIVVIGFVGWKVWNNNQKKDIKSKSTTSSQQTTTNSNASANRYFTITLPTGWSINSDKPSGVTYTEAFTYSDGNGKKLIVYINIGNVGGAGDTSITYTIENDRITLPITDVKLGTCPGGGYPCSIGDGKLKIMASSAEKIKSNNYLFDYSDDTTESVDSLKIMKTLIESMRF